MDALLGSHFSVPVGDSLTVLSSANIVNSGYTSYRLTSGQFSLSQPWQRSRSAGAKRQLDGSPKEQQRQQPACPEDHNDSQQQQQQHVETMLYAHHEVLAAVSAACAQIAAGAVEQPPHDAAPASEMAFALDASAAGAGGAAAGNDVDATENPVPCAEPAAEAEQAATDWTVLAGMKHTLKPKLHFQYTSAQGQQEAVHSKLFDAFISNPSSREAVGAAYDQQVLLPAGCGFCMSDLKAIQPFVQGTQCKYKTHSCLMHAMHVNS